MKLKRWISFTLVFALVLTLSCANVFAKKSSTNVIDVPSGGNTSVPPVVDQYGEEVTKLTDKDGEDLKLVGMPISQSDKLTDMEIRAAEQIVESESYLEEVLEEVGIDKDADEVVLVGTYDLSLRYILGAQTGQLVDVDNFKGWPLYANVSVAGVKAGEEAWLLHFDDTIKGWEDVTVGVYNGYIRGKFNSLSPVAVVRLKDAGGSTGGDSSGDTSGDTSEDDGSGDTSEDDGSGDTSEDDGSGDTSGSASSGSSSKKNNGNSSSKKKSPKTREDNAVYAMMGSAVLLAGAGIFMLKKQKH